MVVAWLGVLQSEAAYVPLDPEYPPARLEALIRDAGAKVVIVSAQTRAALPAGPQLVAVEATDDSVGYLSVSAQDEDRGGDPAYVIYTSGSTGIPKGAVIPHRAINRLVVNTNYIAISKGDRIAQASSASFDAATFEVWGALVNGATLVLVPRHVLLDPFVLAAFLRAEGITVLFLTTALFNQVVADCPDAFVRLRCLLVGGEMADVARFRDVLRNGRPGTLLNVYGPTESTTFATFFAVEDVPEDLATLPIGRPIANTRAYVVDRNLELLPVGATGELVLAGDGVALDYLERPELSAEKFITDRWHGAGGRAYRTGDLVRWRPDGVLEIVGRIDQQLKIRGFRVEPGEVEAALGRHPSVRQVIVVAAGEHSDKRLVAYVVPAVPVSSGELRQFTRDLLPEHLVPSAIIQLDRLPLTRNGKVDRAALPAPDTRLRETDATPPRTPIETALASIWTEILQVGVVGIHDNFFELGGDSIRAIQAVSRAARIGLRITPRQMFKHQSVAELARAIGTVMAPTAEQGVVTGDVPLTPVQHWFLESLPAEPDHFNQAVTLEIPGDVDLDVLGEVAHALLRHHDALRLRLANVEGHWRQWIAPLDEVRLVERYHVDLDEPRRSKEIARLAAQVQRSLDLQRGPLLRMAIFDFAPDLPSRLLVVVHHLAIDVVSWSILLEDLRLAIDQRARGDDIRLPAKTASFKTWAERWAAAGAEAIADGLEWWTAQHPPLRALPIDRDYRRSDNVVASTRTLTASLDVDSTSALIRAASSWDAQIQHVLVAALAQVITDWSGDQNCCLGIEGHGRDALDDEIDVSRTIGWFTTIAPVVIHVPAGPSDLSDLTRSVKQRLTSIPRGPGSHGSLRYLAPDETVRKRAATLPQAQVAFNYLGRVGRRDRDANTADSAALTGPTRSLLGRRRHLIEIDGGVVDGALTLHWTYSAAVHRRATIQRLVDAFEAQLRDVAHTPLIGQRSLAPAAPAARSESGEAIAAPPSGVARTDIDDAYALTPLQEGMLFHSLYEPRGGQYVVSSVLPQRADLDVPRFRSAWDIVVQQNPILRTSFVWEGVDEPRQVVASGVTLTWDIQDWRGFDEQQRDAQFQAYVEHDRKAGFDTTRAPLMRFALIRVSDERWWFVWVCHHLILDGWSRPLVLRDVADTYEQLVRGEVIAAPARRPYRDLVDWLARQDHASAQQFWTDRLSGIGEPTPILAALPLLATAPVDEKFGSRTRVLSTVATERLRTTLRRHQLTLSTAVHGAWALLLGRYTRRADVVFGTTVAGRPAQLEGVEDMIGPFINTIVARVQIQDDAPTVEWLLLLQEQMIAAQEFQYTPLVDMQAWSDVPAGTSLFDSLVVVENYPGMAGATSGEPGAAAREWTNYPLTVDSHPG